MAGCSEETMAPENIQSKVGLSSQSSPVEAEYSFRVLCHTSKTVKVAHRAATVIMTEETERMKTGVKFICATFSQNVKSNQGWTLCSVFYAEKVYCCPFCFVWH